MVHGLRENPPEDMLGLLSVDASGPSLGSELNDQLMHVVACAGTFSPKKEKEKYKYLSEIYLAT